MAMKSNDIENQKLSLLPLDNDVVISGIAGRFPASRNMQELYENLMEKRDMISDDDSRWTKDITSAPHRTGKIHDINKFDAHYFGIYPKQVHAMDPMVRMLLEHTYEAVIDAGLNPKQLRGTKTGVFVGTIYSESGNKFIYGNMAPNSLGITGCSAGMFANRISYFLDVNGPSYSLDTGCSSSLTAMEHAYRAMKTGICDAAIVAGTNLCLLPYISSHFNTLGVLSADGRCKTWDKAADGFVRSEAICVVLLQRAKNAKRIYAKVVHAKTASEGYKEEGISFPSSSMQSQFFRNCYEECGVPPSIVDYVEGHGTGTIVGDSQELISINLVFGHDRTSTSPLLIGSVKSNLGHTEAASGLVAVAKVLLAMELGTIPPNLHYKECKSEATAIKEGRIKVVEEPTPWNGEYAAVNNFGIGGANAHVLLQRIAKDKISNEISDDDLPRLVGVSGRTEEAVTTIFEYLESRPVDVEFVGLLHNIHSDEINGHLYRGYTLLSPRGVTMFPMKEVKSFVKAERPVWFVFSGMGSQWTGMGEALLRLPVFAEAIQKCDVTLKPYGIDIFDVISWKDESAFSGILNRFIGIVAMQIGLVNVLKSIGIEPDNIIGHSFGELASSYADGSLTAEQTILSAYFRGLVSIEMKESMGLGAMAAVGLGYEQIKNICPLDIEVACHNSAGSVTISGPADSIKKFTAELRVKQIFVEDIDVWNIAYHSSYIKDAGPKLQAYLKQVIPDPKPRSSKWMSSSVPMNKWDTELARYSSAEYHTNNFLSPVLFEEVSALIPKNAIAIEIAPHGLLQGILKRSLPPTVTNIALMQRNNKNNEHVFLQAIGKMYNEGLQPQLDKLYPAVSFPVSRGTGMIAPLIKWDHTENWFVVSHRTEGMGPGVRDVTIDFAEDNGYKMMLGHVVDGRNFFPGAGYLTLVWETYGMMNGKHYTECPVVFKDIKFLRVTPISKEGQIKFRVMIQEGTGRFEVSEGRTTVVTGLICGISRPEEEKMKHKIAAINEEEAMTAHDLYKYFKLRGYQYTGCFRSITRATISGAKAHVKWHGDWVTFLDNIMQMKILNIDTCGLLVPGGIKKIVIDPRAHYERISNDLPEPEFEVIFDKLHDLVASAGVEIRGFSIKSIARRKPAGNTVIEEYKFVPFLDGARVSLREMARLAMQITMENSTNFKVTTIELLDEADQMTLESLLSPWISESLKDVPMIQADIVVLAKETKFEQDALPNNVSVINSCHTIEDATALLTVGHRLLADDRSHNLSLILNKLQPGGFVLSRETDIKDVHNSAQRKKLDVILIKKKGNETFVLLRVRQDVAKNTVVIKVCNNYFGWLEKMRKTLTDELERGKTDSTRIFLVSQGDVENGLMGLVNCLKREPGGELIRAVFIQDSTAPEFSLENEIYARQAEIDLTMCVLQENGTWGTFRHLPLSTIKPEPVRHGIVKQLTHGDLSSLAWTEGPIIPEDENDLVNIFYAPLNFKDIMLASGKLAIETFATTRQAEDCLMGFEYSGVNNTNKRVMGILDQRALSNYCIPDRLLFWDIPESWSLEDAATVPIAYATCVYAFYVKTKISRGDKILIHAGAGAVGQAAINLALAEGCEIFTTVGTSEKRKFIREHFPQILDDHIGNSRDTSFEKMIKEQTNGQGVDFILNSLSEEKLLASVNCLAWGGQFLEIGRFDLSADNPLGMGCFMRDVSFHGIVLDRLYMEPDEKKTKFKLLVEKYLKNGAIKPLVRTVFSRDQVEAAFRYMATGKHIGKVVIKVREETDRIDTKVLAMPQYHCLKTRSYIILGGLGGFGVELADWLVMRGAKALVITSRTGIKNGYQKMKVDLWKSYGVNVIIVSGKDASSLEDCRYILETANNLAPVDGVFNLAVLLRDALWENQTAATFEASFRPKAWATKNLDLLTRELCPQLRHFVAFSSMSCGRGNAGQSNYGMSNSVMERICEKRVAEGLPGLAIQWGAIGDVGLVADMQEDDKELMAIGGTMQQSIASCLHELDSFLCQARPIVSSMVIAEKQVKSSDVLSVVDAVLNIMGFKDLKGANLSATLAEMGMDSIMATEVKQTLERNYGIFLNIRDVRNLTFAKLQEMANTPTVAEASSGLKAFEKNTSK